MKYIVLFLFSISAWATQVPGVNNVLNIGGSTGVANPGLVYPASSASSLVTLSAYIASSTSNNFLKLVKWGNGGSTQYQVSAGKTLYITGIRSYMSATQGIGFGYGTTSLLTDNTATAPTSPSYYSSGSGLPSTTLTTGFGFEASPMTFPANSFPFIQTTNSAATNSIVLQGFEQ